MLLSRVQPNEFLMSRLQFAQRLPGNDIIP
jgi:hypothetical protein